MMKNLVITLCLYIVLVLGATPKAHAQEELPVTTNMTLHACQVDTLSVLSRFSPIESVTLTCREGMQAESILAYRKSIVNFEGGVADSIEALDSCQLNLLGGNVRVAVSANLSSRVQLNDGARVASICGFDNSAIHINGGIVTGNLVAEGNSRFVFHGLTFSAVPTGVYNSDGKVGETYSITLTDEHGQTFHYNFRDIYSEKDHPNYHNPHLKFSFVKSE